MPKQITELQVFVAAPSDVDDERRILEQVVTEINNTWSATLNVRLNLISWRTHSVPGVGEDAQDVINRSIPDDYDIFVGVMWARFGVPTHRAGSGTQEEFDRALVRYRRDPSAVKLMFYFKDDPIAPSMLDPAQFAMVSDFKKRLEKEGVLYWSFTGAFDNYVRIHLARQIQDWLTAARAHEPQQTQALAPLRTEELPQDDEVGVLDTLDDFNVRLAKFGEARQRIISAIEELDVRFRERTVEMSGAAGDFRAMKRLANRAAEDIEVFVSRAQTEVPIMDDEFEAAIQSFGTTMALASEFVAAEILYPSTLRDTLSKIIITLESDIRAVVGFRDVVANTPRITTQMNRAKRRANEVLSKLIQSLENQYKLLRQVVTSLPPQ